MADIPGKEGELAANASNAQEARKVRRAGRVTFENRLSEGPASRADVDSESGALTGFFGLSERAIARGERVIASVMPDMNARLVRAIRERLIEGKEYPLKDNARKIIDVSRFEVEAVIHKSLRTLYRKNNIENLPELFVIFKHACENGRSWIDYISELLSSENYINHHPDSIVRLERLMEYARQNGETGLKEYAQLLFPDWFAHQLPKSQDTNLPLPTKAPEAYQGLRGPETPPEFVQRVYGEWLGHGLTKAHIRKLDPKLAVAINNWLSRPGNEWPADVDLPTLKEQNDRWVDRAREQGPTVNLGPEASLRDYHRLTSAIGRRKKDENPNR